MIGQSSGGWTETSSNLMIMYLGHANSVDLVTDDCFTQSNPPIVTTSGTVSTRVDPNVYGVQTGVLSGSVAFSRNDGGDYAIGGPSETGTNKVLYKPVGIFMNAALGNAYENLPSVASGRISYVSGQGTYGNRLFETQLLVGSGGSVGDDITYLTGQALAASRNGYLMPTTNGTTSAVGADSGNYNFSELQNGGALTTLAVLKSAPDSQTAWIVYDQRI